MIKAGGIVNERLTKVRPADIFYLEISFYSIFNNNLNKKGGS